VTAWTSEVSDEHQLLGALLVAFLSHAEIDATYLRGPLDKVLPRPSISVASPAETTSSDFWSALGGKLKPGLDLVVTVAVDAAKLREAGPAVEQYELHLRKGPGGADAGGGRLVGGHLGVETAGAVVSSRRGAGVTRDSGAFVIRAEAGDEVSAIETAGKRPVKGVVPSDGVVDLVKKQTDGKS
jgi:hypothetical protein